MKNKGQGRFRWFSVYSLLIFLLLASVSWSETDVTEKIELIESRLIYNRRAQTSSLDVSLKNNSADVLLSPVKVVIESITGSGVTLTNADGITPEGKPYFEYGGIAAGATSPAKNWVFLNTGRVRFSYTVKVYTDSSDTQPPSVLITNPVDQSVISNTQPFITFSFSDAESGIDINTCSVSINGTDSTALFDMTVSNATCQMTNPLNEGDNIISVHISDMAGNAVTVESNFMERTSSEPIRYIFSLADNDWIFASPGDGTCMGYLNREDIGISDLSDITVLSQVLPGGDLYFSQAGQDLIFKSQAYGTNSVFYYNTQLGFGSGDQIISGHVGISDTIYFSIDGQSGILTSSGNNTNSIFMENYDLGLEETDLINCLHIGYDGTIYFCNPDGQTISQSAGTTANIPFLTSAELGVPGSMINAFAILPETNPPIITIVNPADNSTIETSQPNISIAFSDAESGIDINSFRAEINGVDSTTSFSLTPSGANYEVSSPLPNGNNTIISNISDKVGNLAVAVSDFTVDALDATIQASPVKGGIPLEVQFSANIIGGAAPYTIGWDLNGDDSIDENRQSFNFLYQNYGIYTVNLSVNDSSGKTSTDSITISALSSPSVIASATPNNGSAPLEVAFSATVSDPDGSVVLYEWDFNGDGAFDTSSPSSANAQFTYETSGLYHATLRVTDNDNLVNTSVIIITIGASPTTSAFASPMTGPAPLQVDLTGDGTDPDGTIALYEWDFNGDGIYDWSSSTTGNTTHLYTSAGIFNATFRVTDNEGLIDTDSVLISVSGPPISKPGAFPTSGQAPLTVTFFSNGEDLDGSPEYYDWDFNGDGVRDRRLIASMNTTYTYTQAGTYNATLTVIDNEALESTASIAIAVTSSSGALGIPTAIALAAPSNGGAPLQVALNGKGTDQEGAITKLEWDFEGDGVYDFEDEVVPGSTLGSILDIGSNSSPKLIDIDNDGDLDLFIGENYGQIYFYRNDGNSTSSVWTSSGYVTNSSGITIDAGTRSSPDFADIDGDGDFDLLVGESGGRIYFYRNDGNSNTPVWTSGGYVADSAAATIDVGSYSNPDFVDIDGDGDLDLLVGESGGRIYFYRNDGNSNTPVWTSVGYVADSAATTIDAGSYSSPKFIDIDGDGDYDLLVGESGGRIYFYRNDGNSNTPVWTSVGYVADSAAATIDAGSYCSPDFVDIDGDGDLDIFTGESGGRIGLYNNDGDAGTPAWRLIVQYIGYIGSSSSYSAPCLTDIDNDGDGDLFIGDNNGLLFYYRNDGNNNAPIFTPTGAVMDSTGSIIDAGTRSRPDFTDIDGDGDFDLFIGESYGYIYFYRNDGDRGAPVWTTVGQITNSSGSIIDAGSYSRPVFEDIDNDGDLDLFIGESGGRIYFYRNDGDSSIPVWNAMGWVTNLSGSTIDVGSYSTPDLIDIDSDGDFDLLIGDSNGLIYIYRNEVNGGAPVWSPEGNFTDSSGFAIDVGSYSTPHFVDIDNDDDFDMISGNSSGYIYIYATAGFVKHEYTTPGTYEATLQVTDNDNQTATDSVTITVLETGTPTAAADADPASGIVPLNVSFQGTGNDPDGAIALYEWDFDGDGTYDWSSGSSGNATHVYNQVGRYTARLRVTDYQGKTSTDSVTISTRLSISASRTPIFSPVTGGIGSITSIITGDSIVTVKVIDPSGNTVRTLVDNASRASGTYTDTWDGKTATGSIVRDGVYSFLIEHTENGETQTLDMRETSQYREVTPSRSWPSTFDPYAEDYVHVTYSISYPSEVSMYFWKRDYDHPGSSIAPVRTMFLRQPKDTGSHTEIWDGVDDEGKVVGPWSGGYCITLWTYELPSNAMIVTGNTPVITDVVAAPNFFSPAFNPYGSTEPSYTAVSFNLSESANVEVKIKNSNGVVIDSFNRPDLPAGANTIVWNGKDFDGNLVKDGSYSISLTAIDNDGNRSLPRYTAIIIHY